MTKPFLKWAGGKSQLLEEILAKRPPTFNKYVEPMVGAGAVLFSVLDTADPPSALINDLNAELINAYLQVKDQPDRVSDILQSFTQDAESYYRIRSVERSEEFATWSLEQKAARTIYLNKLGFNGLYRVNASGFFNVPFGKRNGVVFDRAQIRAASTALQQCDIRCGQYSALLDTIERDDWVYLDPPYLPLNESARFTQYTPEGFSILDHQNLKLFVDELSSRGAKVLLSNSHAPEIINLYRDYNISIVFAKRSINVKGNRRGQVPEVLISNY